MREPGALAALVAALGALTACARGWASKHPALTHAHTIARSPKKTQAQHQHHAWLSVATVCTDDQARRLDIRVRMPKAPGAPDGGSNPFVHMLNSTLAATERTPTDIDFEALQRDGPATSLQKW